MYIKEVYVFMMVTIFGGALSSATEKIIRKKRWDDTGDGSSMFRGTAGVDYPDLKMIPTTSFKCEDKIYEGGLYADVEAYCQVYHVCHDGRKDSFLCGRGTIFNQQILACDYWYSAECDSAPNYYHLNSQIGNSYSGNSNSGNGYGAGTPQHGNQAQGVGQTNTGGRINPGVNRPGTQPSGYQGGQNQGSYNGQRNYQSACQCAPGSHKNPWSFPTGMMPGSSDK